MNKFVTVYKPEVEMLQSVVHSNHTLDNGGYKNQLINAVQAVEGVNDFFIDSLEAKESNGGKPCR